MTRLSAGTKKPARGGLSDDVFCCQEGAWLTYCAVLEIWLTEFVPTSGNAGTKDRPEAALNKSCG